MQNTLDPHRVKEGFESGAKPDGIMQAKDLFVCFGLLRGRFSHFLFS